MLSITKRFDFCYGHQLPDHEGKCKNVHGHCWKLFVEVATKDGSFLPTDGPEAGMIMDYGRLKEIVNREIINCLDHKDLNGMFENPTSETIIIWIATTLMQVLPGLASVKLYETDTSYAVWRTVK